MAEGVRSVSHQTLTSVEMNCCVTGQLPRALRLQRLKVDEKTRGSQRRLMQIESRFVSKLHVPAGITSVITS